MPAKKKSAPRKQKSFEESLWDTANKLHFAAAGKTVAEGKEDTVGLNRFAA